MRFLVDFTSIVMVTISAGGADVLSACHPEGDCSPLNINYEISGPTGYIDDSYNVVEEMLQPYAVSRHIHVHCHDQQ
jgi:hypothetical protein